MNSNKKIAVIAALLFVPAAISLSACDVLPTVDSKFDRSTEKSAATSEQAIADGLLPTWVPQGGTDVRVVQRNTGDERLLIMNYAGSFDAKQCLTIKDSGHPTEKELSRAYAGDERFKGYAVKEISSTRTLNADWWPDDAQPKTRWLCGRFWVHQSEGKLYAFGPDTQNTVDKVLEERANASQP